MVLGSFVFFVLIRTKWFANDLFTFTGDQPNEQSRRVSIAKPCMFSFVGGHVAVVSMLQCWCRSADIFYHSTRLTSHVFTQYLHSSA